MCPTAAANCAAANCINCQLPQACRLPYGLLVDGLLRELGDVSYLLSPQDLMAVEQVCVCGGGGGAGGGGCRYQAKTSHYQAKLAEHRGCYSCKPEGLWEGAKASWSSSEGVAFMNTHIVKL